MGSETRNRRYRVRGPSKKSVSRVTAAALALSVVAGISAPMAQAAETIRPNNGGAYEIGQLFADKYWNKLTQSYEDRKDHAALWKELRGGTNLGYSNQSNKAYPEGNYTKLGPAIFEGMTAQEVAYVVEAFGSNKLVMDERSKFHKIESTGGKESDAYDFPFAVSSLDNSYDPTHFSYDRATDSLDPKKWVSRGAAISAMVVEKFAKPRAGDNIPNSTLYDYRNTKGSSYAGGSVPDVEIAHARANSKSVSDSDEVSIEEWDSWSGRDSQAAPGTLLPGGNTITISNKTTGYQVAYPVVDVRVVTFNNQEDERNGIIDGVLFEQRYIGNSSGSLSNLYQANLHAQKPTDPKRTGLQVAYVKPCLLDEYASSDGKSSVVWKDCNGKPEWKNFKLGGFSVVPEPNAKLRINKKASEPIIEGDKAKITWDIEAKMIDNGHDSLRIQDVYPEQMDVSSIDSVSASKGHFTADTGVWQVGQIAKDEVVTLSFTALVDMPQGSAPFVVKNIALRTGQPSTHCEQNDDLSGINGDTDGCDYTETSLTPREFPSVTPVAPSLTPAATCGIEASVSVPETDGVTYTSSRDGATVTVIAKANDGFILSEGATSNWTFEIPVVEPCDAVVIPVAPKLIPAVSCGVEAKIDLPDTEGVNYDATYEGSTVTVIATSQKGFVLKEGSTSTWTFEIPEVEACDEIVTPIAPTLSPAAACGIEATVGIPNMEGASYVQVRDDSVVTITATAKRGFVLKEGATATWTFEIPAVEPCDVPVVPAAPELVPTDVCGIEATVSIIETEGVVYTTSRNGNTVTVNATSEKGFVLKDGATSIWTFEIPEVEACDEIVVPVAPKLIPADTCGVEATVSTPEADGIIYTTSREGNIVSITASAEKGYVLEEGATATWTFEIPAVEPCDALVTPIAPEMVASEVCEVEDTVIIPEMEGVLYAQTREGNVITITASAQEGFTFTEGAIFEWKFEIKEAVSCPVDPVEPEIPLTPIEPLVPIVPADPVKPSVPVVPVTPIVPVETDKPVQPKETPAPVAPVKVENVLASTGVNGSLLLTIGGSLLLLGGAVSMFVSRRKNQH